MSKDVSKLEALLKKEMSPSGYESNLEEFAREGEDTEDLRLALAEGKDFSKGKKVDGNS